MQSLPHIQATGQRRMYIETYGCQMNDYESDRTFRLFRDQYGYTWTDSPTEADLVLFNTCSIRDKADQKAMSSVGALKIAKMQRPDLVVAVGGCLAQSRGGEIQKRFPFVDIVFGTHQWSKLPDLVEKVREDKRNLLETDLFGWRNYAFLPYRESTGSHPVSELVTVQNGCNKFCTFCLVPFTRGREVSRSIKDILEEVKSLGGQGVREVMLLGQNVNAYGRDQRVEVSFTDLLKVVSEADGIDRIRFMTSHPGELTFEMIDAMAEIPEVCQHLHLPLQSGSNRILAQMNRNHDMDRYRELVRYLRKRIPEISLTTDLIVGFPSETEEEFEETLAAVREFDFDDSYSFCYSPRPHTKAADWKDCFVDPKKSADRLSCLQTLQTEIRNRKNLETLGGVFRILVEGKAKKGEGLFSGRTSTNRVVHFPGCESDIGKTVDVKITKIHAHSLSGEIQRSTCP